MIYICDRWDTYSILYHHIFVEGSLEVKLPTIWTDGKAEVERFQRREEKKREYQRREKSQKKEDAGCEKVEKSRFTLFFQWFVALEGRKVGSLKRRVRSHLARWEMKSCAPLWRKAHFKVKNLKTFHFRTTFGSWYVEKMHAVGRRRLGRQGGIKMHASQYVHRNCFIYFALCAAGRQNHLRFLRRAISEKARPKYVS